MKRLIKLQFADFWDQFHPLENYFTQLLAPHYSLDQTDSPDFLLYSCFGKSYRRHQGVRIFYTGENKRPNFRECDFAFTFDHLDRPDHYRLPLYAAYAAPERLIKHTVNAERILAAKTGFCNFVYSNPRCKTRIKFFEKLSKYKRVDSGGRLLNNVGGPVGDKLAFIQSYKFTIAFENDSYPGYTTEKIVEPMMAWSLPIYWGNPLVHLDFNPRSFVNYYDCGSLDALVDRIVELDRHDDLYCEHLRQPWYHDNAVNQYVRPENVVAQFARIFDGEVAPARAGGQSWSVFHWRVKPPAAKAAGQATSVSQV